VDKQSSRNRSGEDALNSFQDHPVALRNEDGKVVIARDAAEEKRLAAEGYERPGKSNPAAYLRAQDMPIEVPFEEWPKMIDGKIVHDPNAPEPKPKNVYPRWVNGKVIETEDDEIEMLLEADEDMRVPAYERAEERAALLARATELGLRVDGRWGLERLRQAVASGGA
jgi:hypothetical protein